MDTSYVEYFTKLNGGEKFFQSALFYGYEGFGVPKHLRMDTIALTMIKDACEKDSGGWKADDENPWIYPVERNVHWLYTFFEPGCRRTPSEHAIGLGPVESRRIPPIFQILATKKMVEPWVVPTLRPKVVPLQAIEECEEFPDRPRVRWYNKFRSPRLPKLPEGWHEIQEIEPIQGMVTYFTYFHQNEGLTYQFQTPNFPPAPVPFPECVELGKVWDQLAQKTVAEVVYSIPNFTVEKWPVYYSYDMKQYWFDHHKRIIKWKPQDPRARMDDMHEWPMEYPENAILDPFGFPFIKPTENWVVEYETVEWVHRIQHGRAYRVNLRTQEYELLPDAEQPEHVSPVEVKKITPVPEPIPQDPRAALDENKHLKFPLTYPEDVLYGSDGLPIIVPLDTGNEVQYASCHHVWTAQPAKEGGLCYLNMLTGNYVQEPPVMNDPRAAWDDGLYWPDKYPPIVRLGEDNLPVIASKANNRVVYEQPETAPDPRQGVIGNDLIWPSFCHRKATRGYDGFPLISVNDKGIVMYTFYCPEEEELPPPENSPMPMIPGPPGRGPEIPRANENITPEFWGFDSHFNNLIRTKIQLKAFLGRAPIGVEIQDSLYLQYLDRLQMVNLTANSDVQHGWDVRGGLIGTMDPVPPGWNLYFSHSNGQPCYYHQYSGRCQYKKPEWPKPPRVATPVKKVEAPMEIEDLTLNSDDKEADRQELVNMSKAMLHELGPDQREAFFRMGSTFAPPDLPAMAEDTEDEDLGPAPAIPPMSLAFLMEQKLAGQQVPDFLLESCKEREATLTPAELKAEAAARQYFEKKTARDQRLNQRIQKLKAAEPQIWRVPSTLLRRMAETQFYTNLDLLELSLKFEAQLTPEEQAEERKIYYAFAQSQVHLFDLLAQQPAQEALQAAEEAAKQVSPTLAPPRMKGDPSRLIGTPESDKPMNLPMFVEDAKLYNDMAQIVPAEFLEQYDVFEYKPLMDRLMERRNSEDNAPMLPPPPPLEIVNGEVVLPPPREFPSPTSILRMSRAQNDPDQLHEVSLEDLLTHDKKVQFAETAPVPASSNDYRHPLLPAAPATRPAAQLHQMPPPKIPAPPPPEVVTAYRHPILTAAQKAELAEAQRAELAEAQRAELAAASKAATPPIVAEPPAPVPTVVPPLAADGSRSVFFKKWRQVPGNQGPFEGAILGNFLRDLAFMGISHQFISWLQLYPDCNDQGVGFQLDLDLYDQQHPSDYVPPPLMKIHIGKPTPRSPKESSPIQGYPGRNAFERSLNLTIARNAQEKKDEAKQKRLANNPPKPKTGAKRRTSGGGPSATRRKYN